MEQGFIIINETQDTNIDIDNIIYENIDNNIYEINNPLIITQNNLIVPYKIQQKKQTKNIQNLLLYFILCYKLSTINWALLQSPFFVSKHI